MKYIIYHHPMPLSNNPKSGSQIRPVAMLQAFKDLGYHVDVVAGYANDRRIAIKKIISKIESGTRYDFMYCENTSMPTQLTEKHHLPIAPNLDFGFFDYLNKKDIPIGLFYRDIYWKFRDDFKVSLTDIKAVIARAFYHYELLKYNKVLTKMYIPSFEMQEYIPHIKKSLFSALPPGHNIEKSSLDIIQSKSSSIKLFYVGGLNDYYNLKLIVNVLKDYPNIQLTICTREEDWLSAKHEYKNLSKNVKVIHKSGSDLIKYYSEADICILYLKPIEYRDFAMPIKLFEYIGYRKPILSSSNTLAAKFIASNYNGWVVEHNELALRNFLEKLKHDDIIKKHTACELCAVKNTWQSRALQVANDLSI